MSYVGKIAILAERLALKMLSRVVDLSSGELSGLRSRPILKTAFWLQNGPWRSSVLSANRQAAIDDKTSTSSVVNRLCMYIVLTN
jgi:hypothetical protein